MSETPKPMAGWEQELDARTRTHIAFCRIYAQYGNHDTPGHDDAITSAPSHIDLITIAELAWRLDAAHAQIATLKGQQPTAETEAGA